MSRRRDRQQRLSTENITPGAAQKMLTDMQLGTSFVIVARPTLIVTDYTYRMDRIEQVITLVDVAGEPKPFNTVS